MLGPTLPHPHQSDVRGGPGLRELRPRAGRSRIRPLYARVGDTFVILTIGPEAVVDRRGFDRAVRVAAQRLAEVDDPSFIRLVRSGFGVDAVEGIA